jgi:hypothetical protein
MLDGAGDGDPPSVSIVPVRETITGPRPPDALTSHVP